MPRGHYHEAIDGPDLGSALRSRGQIARSRGPTLGSRSPDGDFDLQSRGPTSEYGHVSIIQRALTVTLLATPL